MTTSSRTIQANGCELTLHAHEGPVAREWHIRCSVEGELGSSVSQAEALYEELRSALAELGLGFDAVVTEWVFFRDISNDQAVIQAARDKATLARAGTVYTASVNEIEQPPLSPQGLFEMWVYVVVPIDDVTRTVYTKTDLPSDSAVSPYGLRLNFAEESRFYANNLFGNGDDAYTQTHAMFELAEELLIDAGFTFADVMRTWIYFSDMERDYAQFNKARSEFFTARDVNPIPASTGIGAGFASTGHNLSLGVYANSGSSPTERIVMSTPTLNEAWEYGSDFSRGMRVEEANSTALYISGTASLDESGATVHLDDLEQQAERMLDNVSMLLQQQGASFADVASAITYIKHPQDMALVEKVFARRGYVGFPSVIVKAEVCRPELLCETELMASL